MDKARTPAARRGARWLLGCCATLGFTDAALADAVTDWNAIVDDGRIHGGPTPDRFRVVAMAQLAVHDALNAIKPRYQSYSVVAPANPAASPEAAVAAAAYGVMYRLETSHSDQVFLVERYSAAIAALPPCPAANPTCIQDGIATGTAAALAVIALRYQYGGLLAIDGSGTPSAPYLLPPEPGVYQPTPPDFQVPLYGGWPGVDTFALSSGAQFQLHRSDILDLASDTYARDYQEVLRVGALGAETRGDRSAAQSANARLWPLANWNRIGREVVAGVGLDLWQHARLFALLAMAQADGAISAFDSKYRYNAWRPVSAIRRGGEDGNVGTIADPEWLPYLATPPYPAYTCAVTVTSGAASEILSRYFNRDDLPFQLTDGVDTLGFATMSQARTAAEDARVHAGANFRSACEAGTRQGEKIGGVVIQHYLRPLRRTRVEARASARAELSSRR